MSTFKVGDRVRKIISPNAVGQTSIEVGTIGKVIEMEKSSNWPIVEAPGWCGPCNPSRLELLEDKPFGPLPYSTGILERMITLSAGVTYTNTKTNKTLMSSMTSFLKNLTRQEPEKSFVQAGFLDENDNVTEKGEAAIEYILWNANKDALKALADQVIAEEKK
jgi:hypothetical protein